MSLTVYEHDCTKLMYTSGNGRNSNVLQIKFKTPYTNDAEQIVIDHLPGYKMVYGTNFDVYDKDKKLVSRGVKPFQGHFHYVLIIVRDSMITATRSELLDKVKKGTYNAHSFYEEYGKQCDKHTIYGKFCSIEQAMI